MVIVAKAIHVKKFRNIKKASLGDLRDLNILIGPNNCGKTNILEFLRFLSDMRADSHYSYMCEECERVRVHLKGAGIQHILPSDDFYMKSQPPDNDVEVRLLLNKELVDELVPKRYERQAKSLNVSNCREIKDEIVLRNKGIILCGVHFSPFIDSHIIDEVKPTLYCPESRLQSYKGKSFKDYLSQTRPSGTQMTRLVNLMRKVVDPRIQDHRYEDLIRKVNDSNLTVPISEQGSGVRSLVCIAADILAYRSRILLIDEPELGLNPLAKQELLSFLLDELGERQVFLATQDPDFVNPVLWSNHASRIAIYLFSPQAEEFVRIPDASKENPEIFAGYLPHTTSLKSIHVYVEGPSDVYIVQTFLRKRLEIQRKIEMSYIRYKLGLEKDSGERSPVIPKDQYSFQVENRIGVFHLWGDFWRHLLYTVPKKPYRCVVILDGDKKNQVEEVLAKQNSPNINCARFGIARSANEVRDMFRGGEEHPVYCLKKDRIEDYLFEDYPCPAHFVKEVDGPLAAEALRTLPEEIVHLFSVIVHPDSFYPF
ncbi:AAA family ATPase [Candidatus Bathyarchaeota archaeon]|nr:AAA family ATPase [Candidatus Bathyarchaeota archaeon]